MRTRLALLWLVCCLGSSPPVLAQAAVGQDTPSGTLQPVEWRLSGVRRASPSGPGRLEETTGVLISDPARQVLRFEARGRDLFAVAYGRITVIHYEEGKYPQRFLHRSSFYLTFHYADDTGRDAFETVRLLSREEALSALETIGEHTGCPTDRSDATESFLGIPIRAETGTRVVITDVSGRTVKGVIRQLSSSSLALDDSTGTTRVFDEADVRRIRLAYSPKRDAFFGLGVGFAAGAGLAYVAAGLGGCFNENRTTNCDVVSEMLLVGAITGGTTALIVMTVRALLYPVDSAFDVYRGETPGASRGYTIAIAPQVGPASRGVVVVVRF